MKIHYHLASVVMAAALIFGALPALAADPTGVWLTQDGDAHIKFASCGQAFCGTVVWLRDPLDPDTKKAHFGQEQSRSRQTQAAGPRDHHRIELQGRRRRKICRQFYNSDDGQTYNGNIVRSGPSTLKVEGCLGALCQTQVWTKVAR